MAHFPLSLHFLLRTRKGFSLVGGSQCTLQEPPYWNLPATEAGPDLLVCNLCCCTGPCAQKGPVLGLKFCYCNFEIINNFLTRGPAFLFCTGPCKLYSCLLRGRFYACKGRPVVLEGKLRVNRDVFR